MPSYTFYQWVNPNNSSESKYAHVDTTVRQDLSERTDTIRMENQSPTTMSFRVEDPNNRATTYSDTVPAWTNRSYNVPGAFQANSVFDYDWRFW